MRYALLALALVFSACGPSQTLRQPAGTNAEAGPPARDPSGAASPLAPSRDVLLEGVSIVGRWEAYAVLGDDLATLDLQRGTLTKTLIVNPTGRVTLRGQDEREGGGEPVSYSGTIEGNRVRLAGLTGEATLALERTHLALTDPGGTTTVYLWSGR